MMIRWINARKVQDSYKQRSKEFVQYSDNNVEKFKYKFTNNIKYILGVSLGCKRFCNKMYQTLLLQLHKIDWQDLAQTLAFWTINVFIEGLLFNFVLYKLLNFEFTITTSFAWGISVYLLIDVVERLRNDGSGTKVLSRER